ncbi:MAG: hypothetical protein WBI91_07585 [Coriobacteriia bacterium]
MGPQVHLKLTRIWAMEEGFSEREAEFIAHADSGFDRRYPARASFVNITRHFAPTAWIWSLRYLGLAARWGDLMMLGYSLHCAQDGVAHGRIGTRHLVQATGLRPNPDVWETSPAGVKRRTEAVTRERLRRFRKLRAV